MQKSELSPDLNPISAITHFFYRVIARFGCKLGDNYEKMRIEEKTYTITKDYAEKLKNKIGLFKEETGTKKTVFLTFLSTFGLQPNEYSLRYVQDSLDMEALFE